MMVFEQPVIDAYRKVLEEATRDFNEGASVDVTQVILHDGLEHSPDRMTWMFCSVHPSMIDLRVSKNWVTGIGELVCRFNTEMMREGAAGAISARIIESENQNLKRKL